MRCVLYNSTQQKRHVYYVCFAGSDKILTISALGLVHAGVVSLYLNITT
jgi:adenine/guanine phosphoribosyltransferase-like PRPP-binding protein